MGTINFYAARNMAAAQTWYGSVTDATSSQITITNGYNTTVYYGSFGYSGSSVYGTLTGLVEYAGSSLVLSASGFNIDASVANQYINGNQLQNIFQVALAGSDTITGSSQNDVLFGYGGNDFIAGGSGYDVIYGGDGTDTAIFSGLRNEYRILVDEALITVIDNSPERNGTKVLLNFEFLKFSDQTIPNNFTPTYALSASSASVNEGSSTDFILTTTNVQPGTKVAYTLSGISAADVQGGLMSGFFAITADGRAMLTVRLVADGLPEGPETLTVSAAEERVSVVINDTSVMPIYSDLSATSSSVDEGGEAQFILVTTGVPTGTLIEYVLSGVAADDIQSGSLLGFASVSPNGWAIISISVLADSLTEGLETLTVTAAGRTSSITVNDTSVPVRGGNIEFYTAYNMAAAQTWFGNVTGNTASQITVTDGYHATIYYGSFRYNGISAAGTLTGLAEYTGSALSILASGFSVDAALVAQYVNANQPQNVFQIALANSDTISGSSGNDVLLSYGGDDSVQGNGGNDTLDGGGGLDTAVFAGSRSQYSVSGSGISIIVSDNVAGRDGLDTLRDFEFLSFSDQTISTNMSWLTGTNSSDTFTITSGSNSVDGGAGADTVQYQTTRSLASVTYSNGSITVSKNSGTDTLTSVERIDFTDGDLVFDVESSNAPAAYRLYGGAFDRTPDEGGFRYWTQTFDKGASLHDVAASFIESSEFIARYGSSLANAAFVDALYLNVLGRSGESGGVAHWNRMLDNNYQDRADVLVEFTQLPEYVGISLADITNGYWVV